jgi:hypothetical protein
VRHDLVAAGEAAIEAYFVTSNLIRRQLSPLGRARCIRRLMEVEKSQFTSNYNWWDRDELKQRVGKAMGMSARNISRYLLVLDAPIEVQHALDRGEIKLIDAGKVALLGAAVPGRCPPRKPKAQWLIGSGNGPLSQNSRGNLLKSKEIVMPKKKARPARERRADARAANGQAVSPNVPTLVLCALYQLLCNLQRIEPSIRRTTDRRYALLIGSKNPKACIRGIRRVVVPTERRLMFGTYFEEEGTVDGGIDVKTCRLRERSHFGDEKMLDELIRSIAVFGHRPERYFSDAIAAISALNDPRFTGCSDYLEERDACDVLDEIADRVCEQALAS